MLYRVKDLRRCKIRARDGELGHVDDVFFDDRDWTIAYVVVDTKHWLSGRQVLLPRATIGRPDWAAEELEVDLSVDEIEHAPGVESDPPLAYDAKHRFYQSWVWQSQTWGGFVGGVSEGEGTRVVDRPTTHLRSAMEIEGYRVESTDGRIGHVDDFLFDGEDLVIRYVVIDTRNWLPGRQVVIPPSDVQRLVWTDEIAQVALTNRQIENAPELEHARVTQRDGGRLLVIR